MCCNAIRLLLFPYRDLIWFVSSSYALHQNIQNDTKETREIKANNEKSTHTFRWHVTSSLTWRCSTICTSINYWPSEWINGFDIDDTERPNLYFGESQMILVHRMRPIVISDHKSNSRISIIVAIIVCHSSHEFRGVHYCNGKDERTNTKRNVAILTWNARRTQTAEVMCKTILIVRESHSGNFYSHFYWTKQYYVHIHLSNYIVKCTNNRLALHALCLPAFDMCVHCTYSKWIKVCLSERKRDREETRYATYGFWIFEVHKTRNK